MRYLLCTVLGFIAGAGITYILEEAKVEKVSQQREASVREYYHNKEKEKESDEDPEETTEEQTNTYIPTDYVASSAQIDDDEEEDDDISDDEGHKEPLWNGKPPEPISYDEFANDEDYEPMSTWSYNLSDDILYNADKKALTQTEVEMYVGSKNIRDAITEGLTMLYIRNEQYHMDIEVNISND
ncbi:MAG: hypothetical protein J6U54_01740 [Clostridiales bacterium]|nr:hypothetical protein [Clostridiales bacterium]